MRNKRKVLKELLKRLEGRLPGIFLDETYRPGGSVCLIYPLRGKDGFIITFSREVADGVRLAFSLDYDRTHSPRRSFLAKQLTRLEGLLSKELKAPLVSSSDKRHAAETDDRAWYKLNEHRWDTIYLLQRFPGDWSEIESAVKWLETKVMSFVSVMLNLPKLEIPPLMVKGYEAEIAPFNHVFQFKITLLDVEPEIWRRIQVPETYTFWDLHMAIQNAMGWQNMHLHEFAIWHPLYEGIKTYIGIPDDSYPDERYTLSSWHCFIANFFSWLRPTADYVYDFGDNWCHQVVLEKIMPKEPGKSYPACVSGARACPPEDCGGTYQFMEMLTHEDWESYPDYRPDLFQPNKVKFVNPRRALKDIYQGELN